MGRDAFGSPVLALEKDQDRLLALLSAAQERPASPDTLRHLQDASNHWRRGDKALANIRSAFAGLPRLDGPFDAYRLFLAEELLGAGMSPDALMKGLGFPAPARGLAKFDPNQPRVPAGNGRASGRWGSGGGTQDSVTARTLLPPAPEEAARAARILRAARRVGTLAQGLFEAVESSPFLAGLARLAAGAAGPFVTLGAIFIPTPAGRISQGAIPGEPDLHYSFDEPAGVLRLYREGENGRQYVAWATRAPPHDIFIDHDTGEPIARLINHSLVFDADSLAEDGPGSRPGSETDEPKLCPAPSKDVGHGASERADAYQAQISRLNNPQRPLPPGMAVRLNNPETGNDVVFDDCRVSDGTMIEVKGPGFASQMRYDHFELGIVPDWEKQASAQVAASRSRGVNWFFAEPDAAERAKELFENDAKLRKIKVFHVPAETR